MRPAISDVTESHTLGPTRLSRRPYEVRNKSLIAPNETKSTSNVPHIYLRPEMDPKSTQEIQISNPSLFH